ncbi:MAG: right-handed parallel beta-helix repeat-containing protein [Thermoplasmatota archaeon]
MNTDKCWIPILAVLMVLLLIPGAFSVSSLRRDDVAVRSPTDEILDINRIGNWSVTTTEIYSDTTIHLSGNLSVSGKLVLDNTTLIVNVTGQDLKTLKIETGGAMIVGNQSRITSNGRGRYRFISDTGSSLLINRSSVEDCGIPSFTIDDQGIFARSSSLRIIDSEILEGETGIVSDGAAVTIVRSNITRMNNMGILATNGTVLNISASFVSQNPFAGIELRASTADLYRCTFVDVERSVVTTGSKVTITSSNLFGFSQSVAVFNSSIVEVWDSASSVIGGGQIHVSRPASVPSSVLILNSTFRGVRNDDAAGDVKEAYRFDVKVLTNGMVPAKDSDVEIKDITGRIIFQGLTGMDGYIHDIPLAYLTHNVTGGFRLTPHNFSVMFEGATRYATSDVTRNHYVQIIVLRSDPEVVIEYPADGEWLSDSSFYLNGRIEDVRPITDIWMSLDGRPEIRVPQSSPFSIPLELPDGPHTLRIVAKNDDGRYGNSTISFGIDTVFPVLVVGSPVSPYYTNKTTVWVQGSCSDDADLTVNGEMVPHPDGEFRTLVVLNEGKNDVLLRAVDRAGNTATARITVHSDTTPPSILVFSPTNGTKTNKQEIMVRGKTDSDTSTLTVNGIEVPLDSGEFEILLTDLLEGTNRIHITAIDRMGSQTMKTVVVIVDLTPPSITITEAPHLTNENTVTIKGTTEPGSQIIINNRIVPLEGSTFSGSVELIEGENDVNITAIDDLGNRRSVHRKIILDTVPPSFESIDPSSGSRLTNPILEMKGVVFDENGIESVRARTADLEYEEISREEDFSWIISLVRGVNIIDLEAEDEAGNIAFLQITYTYEPKVTGEDLEAPTIVITDPSPNSTLEVGRHTIEGWAMDDTELASVHVRIDEGEWMEVTGLNSWYVEVDLDEAKIYKIEARAVDSSGNEEIARMWTTVVKSSSSSADEGDGPSSSTVIMIVVLALIFLVAFVFGYLLISRNRALREQLLVAKEKRTIKERMRGSRRPRRIRDRRASHDPEEGSESMIDRRSDESPRELGRSRREH